MSLTFHELTAEINRLESKLRRQEQAAQQTAKLIASLRNLRDTSPAPKTPEEPVPTSASKRR